MRFQVAGQAVNKQDHDLVYIYKCIMKRSKGLFARTLVVCAARTLLHPVATITQSNFVDEAAYLKF